jgi:hypothetical protein
MDAPARINRTKARRRAVRRPAAPRCMCGTAQRVCTSITNHGQSYETPRTSCRRPSRDPSTSICSPQCPLQRNRLHVFHKASSSTLAPLFSVRLVAKRVHAADQLYGATEPACALPSGRDGSNLFTPAVCAAKACTTLALPPARFTRVDSCETHTESCSQRGRPCRESPQFAPGAGRWSYAGLVLRALLPRRSNLSA